MPAGEAFGVHPARHPREPEVEAGEDAEDRSAEQDVMQVRDDPIRVLERIVERNRRLEHAVDPTDDEHRDEADREQHRRLEFDRPAPHRRDPVEDLDAARHRDRQGDDHEREARGDRDAGREHVVDPDAEGEEPDRDGRSMMNRVGTRIASRASIRSAASSSRNVPCSIVRHPARSAAMIPGLPWQWAATTRSARAASPTIASSSSRENCAWTGWSSSLATPPDARTLMTLAPIRSCIRTPFRHSGTPSQRHEKPVRRNTSWMKSSGNAWRSPWPPV